MDELDDLARISGMPEIKRKAKDHPLNQKAVPAGQRPNLAESTETFNFVVAHMGGAFP